jgi:hypothetical protein
LEDRKGGRKEGRKEGREGGREDVEDVEEGSISILRKEDH